MKKSTKIQKNVIKPITVTEICGIKTASPSKFKFTPEECKFAFKSAMRIRSRSAKRFGMGVNSISMKLCLNEAYRRIKQEKLIMSGILSNDNKKVLKDRVKSEFGHNNINTMVRDTDITKIVPKDLLQMAILNVAKFELSVREIV